MEIEIRDYQDKWQEVKNATMNTVNKNSGKYPESDWKLKLLLSEHSPIRKIKIGWRWTNIKYWVSVHICRHFMGIVHFVSTQRTDRTGVNRDEIEQGNTVNHECDANAQALINISRKRLCHCASAETRKAWQLVKYEVSKIEPELASCMVKECVYRNGMCPEMFSCEYNKTEAFEKELSEYTEFIQAQINPKTNIHIIK